MYIIRIYPPPGNLVLGSQRTHKPGPTSRVARLLATVAAACFSLSQCFTSRSCRALPVALCARRSVARALGHCPTHTHTHMACTRPAGTVVVRDQPRRRAGPSHGTPAIRSKTSSTGEEWADKSSPCVHGGDSHCSWGHCVRVSRAFPRAGGQAARPDRR